MTDAIAAVLAELLHAGHRVIVVTIDEVEVPPLRGLLVAHLDGVAWTPHASTAAATPSR